MSKTKRKEAYRARKSSRDQVARMAIASEKIEKGIYTLTECGKGIKIKQDDGTFIINWVALKEKEYNLELLKP